MDAEIAMVHLVDNGIGNGGCLRPTVVAPAFGIGSGHIDYCGTPAVGAHGLGPDSRRLRHESMAGIDPEGVEFTQQFLWHRSPPGSVFTFCHVKGVNRGTVAVGGI